MKALKILLILLVPAIGFVGCKKADCKPSSSTTTAAPAPAQPGSSAQTSARHIGGTGDVQTLGEDGTTIVGSGDDDRDGGDRGRKKTAK